jgi:hypothetical protein
MRYFILYLVLISFHSFAQSSIVAGSSDEMTLRDLQLTGRYDENASFTSRLLSQKLINLPAKIDKKNISTPIP